MKIRSPQAATFIALVLAASCSDAASTVPLRGRLTAVDVAGTWNIAFRLDSALLRPPAVGSLVVSDQYDPLHTEYLTAALQVDFRPLLGRQVSCLYPLQASLVQPRDSGVAYFWFTPQAADCGLYAVGRFDRQEFHGEWGEPSATSQLLSHGTFRMWRQR